MNKYTKFVTIFFILLIGFIFSACQAVSSLDSNTPTATDNNISQLIEQNSLKSLTSTSSESSDLVVLGETLFADVSLSGNRNISCSTCHNPNSGSVDHLPFSIGTGATGIDLNRKQVNGQSLPTTRNSPALYNLGRSEQLRSFFDGRVSLINQVVTSPVGDINGSLTSRKDITSLFTNVVEVQPLFPLITSIEMLGSGNDLSAHSTSVGVWQAILTDRILTQSKYVSLFAKAFPTTSQNNLNPGHIGRAIGAYMKIHFTSNQTGFDKYLAGDLQALSESQKRGLIVFYTKGQCFRCHSGSNFTDNNFHTSGAPQIGTSPFVDDVGLEAITGLSSDRYRFKTPSLRNLSLTAPYMHDGAFQTLEDVVSHYNQISTSLANYKIPTSYQSNYALTLTADTSATRNATRLNQVDNRALSNGLRLTATEQADLVEFLRNGLRDFQFN
jgi:cytochrome c peroxidase